MAHECPDCGMQCHCGGDIDDCCLNAEEDVNACTHCRCSACGKWPDDCECDMDFFEDAFNEEEDVTK
jgi:hypothetical protein